MSNYISAAALEGYVSTTYDYNPYAVQARGGQLTLPQTEIPTFYSIGLAAEASRRNSFDGSLAYQDPGVTYNVVPAALADATGPSCNVSIKLTFFDAAVRQKTGLSESDCSNLTTTEGTPISLTFSSDLSQMVDQLTASRTYSPAGLYFKGAFYGVSSSADL